MITVKEINPNDFDATFGELGCIHSDELGETYLGVPSIDVDVYNGLGAAAKIWGMFKNEEPIGYCSAFVTKHNHYDALVCVHDTLYAAEGYRGDGWRLMRKIKQFAKANGCVCVFWTAKPDSPFADMLQSRYKLEELKFVDVINQETPCQQHQQSSEP